MTPVYQKIQDLPSEIPVFPLARAILLPDVVLPLNIFEPRYLAMVDFALSKDRIIGMIQPRPDGNTLFETGCAGRIISYNETEDGRYLITLKGVCRFKIMRENAQDKGGFRKVTPDWSGFDADLVPPPQENICRDAMLETLRAYLHKMDMLCDQWETMQTISCDKLTATLSMICPFSVTEKQMLLEAKDLESRMKLLKAFFEEAISQKTTGCASCH